MIVSAEMNDRFLVLPKKEFRVRNTGSFNRVIFIKANVEVYPSRESRVCPKLWVLGTLRLMLKIGT
jgi:hypothetical protein